MKSESRLQRKIRKALEDEGGFVFKIHGGPFQRAGLPDLFMILDGQTYGFEVKCPGETASKIQLHVMTQMRAAGAVVSVVDNLTEVLNVVRQVRSLSARGREIYAKKLWYRTICRARNGEDLDHHGSDRETRKG